MSNVSNASPAFVAADVPLSIRLLRRTNPLIVRLLRSPLHGLLSRDLLVLTYSGRRSGTRYTLPLSYVALGDHLYLCTRTTFWWKNLRDGGDVEVVLRGKAVTMTPTVLDPNSDEALRGMRAFLTNNPGTGVKLYNVRRGKDGRPVEEDLQREVVSSVVVRLNVRSGSR
jgi:hypothetical protein